MNTEQYKQSLHEKTLQEFQVASKARKRGFDPSDEPEIQLARNMAERVVGLVSVLAPQVVGSGVAQRIEELEKEYGVLDWRVSLTIAYEVAQQKFCTFKNEIEAYEVGIRIGFAYATVGVVSSPLEGFVNLEIKDRRDKRGKYFCINFSGPIRNAGGTAAAQCVIIADYVRIKTGYDVYDPTEEEIARCAVELDDYHERVTNLQYKPSAQESDFLMRYLPVEISGDPSEKIDVSNFKNLPRIPTNKIRSGYCLLHSSCIPLKAPKLWKQLNKWGKDFGMEHWSFLEKFIKLQKKMQAGKSKASTEGAKITPNYTYISDLVAGRPVFGHPLRPGAFRLRYGRARTSGLSAQSIHPASMVVMRNFIATASQLKVERPGKAAAFTVCDAIEGPIVRLTNGDVLAIRTEEEARAIKKDIEKILFIGDVLVCYGDFVNRAHPLCPVGYCEEWWTQEIEKAINESSKTIEELSEEASFDLKSIIDNPFQQVPFSVAMFVTDKLNVPLHPKFTYYWKLISRDQLTQLIAWLTSANLTFKGNHLEKIILPKAPEKNTLEELGIPHKATPDHIILEESALPLVFQLGVRNQGDIEELLRKAELSNDEPLEFLQKIIPLRDKAGTFIGGRLGRPEKAKMRSLSSTPHGLFPVSVQGGRLRSIQGALEKGHIEAEVALYVCEHCGREGIYQRCLCGKKAKQAWWHPQIGVVKELPANPPKEMVPYKKQRIPTREHLDVCLKLLHTQVYPDLIKGVRGMSGKEHNAEHLIKAVLRAKHDLTVNKDGTVRYDASEVPLTHFKPQEVGTSVKKLLELGYTHDIEGAPLTNENQVLLLRPQDIVLPSCPDSPDERTDAVLLRVTKFIDELLVAYGEKPFYNCVTREDLVGQLVIGLAPHTSAGMVGRIVGFSQTQGLFCHPYYHCAMRRDCFTYETTIPIKENGKWKIEKIGELVEKINPDTKVDVYGTLEKRVSKYKTIGVKNGRLKEIKVDCFTKHTPQKVFSIKTSLERKIRTTHNHKHTILRDDLEKEVKAFELKKGDKLKIPYKINILEKDIKEINLIDELSDRDWLMIRGLRGAVLNLKSELKKTGVKESDANNFFIRDSVPVKIALKIISKNKTSLRSLRVAAKRDNVSIPAILRVSDDFLTCVGLYVAEGYAREGKGKKGFYQVYIAAQNEEVREFIRSVFDTLGLSPSENKTDRVTYSSRIIYELFTKILKAGSDAREKKIPDRFLSLPLPRAGKILGGYFEGDGSVSKGNLRMVFDTVSELLKKDLEFLFARFGVFVKYKTSTRLPGKRLKSFYERKEREIPKFTCTRGTIQSKFVHSLSKHVEFVSSRKRSIHKNLLKENKFRNVFLDHDEQFIYDTIIEIEEQKPEITYCLSVKNHFVVANGILTKQCDGDESCVFLLMDAFLNFSKGFLPTSRGGTMDAPLVLTTVLNPSEVDDMVFDMDTAARYPLALYEAALEYKMPWEVKISQIKGIIGTENEDLQISYTHPVTDMNAGVLCSSYKTLPSMQDKLQAQMKLAEELRAVDEQDVARLVIEKHFIRDVRGNLRKFSTQQFRCLKCNDKYRRPPITRNGACTACGGRVGFTISEGSVVKYLEPMESLARTYNLAPYLQQTIALTRRRVEEVFGKDSESQTGLGAWFG